jgi:hypothetical protein
MLPLILLVLLQGVPVPAFQSGSITGVLTNSTGKPAAGVRVSALVRPESPTDALMASTMAGIAETDQNGVYKLENIPPGHYYIVAGRVDLPTYYPGTLEMAAGKDVLITPGATITGMNFALKDNSVGRSATGGYSMTLATSWTVPVRVAVEGGGKIPIYDGGLFPVLRLTRVSDNQTVETPLASASLVVPLTASPEYRVTIENLSTRYRVKSIVSDKVNLISTTLKLPAPLSPIPVTPNAQGIFSIAVQGGNVSVFTFATSGATSVASVIPPLPPVATIEITLAEVAATISRTGATLSGTIPQPLTRSIQVSGIAGSVYEDGTFEVRNIPPGRHTIFTGDNPLGTRPVGASIIVGNQDIRDMRLQQILEIPRDFDANIASTMPATLSAGTVAPLATIRGHLVDEATGNRFDVDRSVGRITLNGNTVSYTINNTGEFEIQRLLPGRYDLELSVFGGATYTRSLDVRDGDMTLQWAVSVPN